MPLRQEGAAADCQVLGAGKSMEASVWQLQNTVRSPIEGSRIVKAESVSKGNTINWTDELLISHSALSLDPNSILRSSDRNSWQ